MMTRPPISAITVTGGKALQYMHRARLFRVATTQLPDYYNGEQFWPKYAMLTHAIELALKAFADHSIQNGRPSPAREPKQHDLSGCYELALQYGLPDEPELRENIDALNQLHLTQYTRYPTDAVRPIPDARSSLIELLTT